MSSQVGEHCFICRSQLESCEHCSKCQKQSKVKVQKCQLFCGVVSRHLNLGESKLNFEAATTLSNQNKDNDFLHTCDHCYEMVDDICKIYDEWKNLELKLTWNLERLSELVMPNLDPDTTSAEGDHANVNTFRREFLHQLQSTNLANPPTLRLEKLNQERAPISDSDDQEPDNFINSGHGPISNAGAIKTESEDEVETDTMTMWADLKLEADPEEMDAPPTSPSPSNLTESETAPPPPQTLDLERDEIPDLSNDDVDDETSNEDYDVVRVAVTSKTEAAKKAVVQKENRSIKRKSTEKLFQCSVCPRTYRRKDNLKRHARSHVGLKPYECTICGEKFSRKDYHLNHERKHRGEPTRWKLKPKKIPCRFCGKCFPVNCVRIRHERTHTGLKPFSCSTCGKKFTSSEACRMHLRKSH